MIGSAFLTAVVRKGKDITTVAHLGRYIPVELQTALVVQGHECEIAGCGLRGYLERDHIHDHAKRGRRRRSGARARRRRRRGDEAREQQRQA